MSEELTAEESIINKLSKGKVDTLKGLGFYGLIVDSHEEYAKAKTKELERGWKVDKASLKFFMADAENLALRNVELDGRYDNILQEYEGAFKKCKELQKEVEILDEWEMEAKNIIQTLKAENEALQPFKKFTLSLIKEAKERSDKSKAGVLPNWVIEKIALLTRKQKG